MTSIKEFSDKIQQSRGVSDLAAFANYCYGKLQQSTKSHSKYHLQEVSLISALSSVGPQKPFSR